MIVPGKDGQVQQTIDMSQTTPIKCEKCGHVNAEFEKMETT